MLGGVEAPREVMPGARERRHLLLRQRDPQADGLILPGWQVQVVGAERLTRSWLADHVAHRLLHDAQLAQAFRAALAEVGLLGLPLDGHIRGRLRVGVVFHILLLDVRRPLLQVELPHEVALAHVHVHRTLMHHRERGLRVHRADECVAMIHVLDVVALA
jgi:hypothetical protein